MGAAGEVALIVRQLVVARQLHRVRARKPTTARLRPLPPQQATSLRQQSRQLLGHPVLWLGWLDAGAMVDQGRGEGQPW